MDGASQDAAGPAGEEFLAPAFLLQPARLRAAAACGKIDGLVISNGSPLVEPLFIAQTDPSDGSRPQYVLPAFANRHGCITGATGTGKTVTLQVMAENFSRIGVPVFMADVKGDLTGISQAGTMTEKLKKRLESHGMPEPVPGACPVSLWDVFGELGTPVRATIASMGPLLLSSLLKLNDTQTGVLNAAFKFASDKGMDLTDLKDLQALLTFIGENAAKFKLDYGNVSAATIGAIQRGLMQLQVQGGDKFFGEPMLDIADLMQTVDGKGVVNILAADKLMQNPMLYSTFLLWLLNSLYNTLPEAGDLEKPKFVFFFDEAHLLFDNCPKALTEKVEQVVRLIRSKGVGVYFVTQSPIDIPDNILGQLGNRVQHALRAFTPKDQKAVKSVGETMRPNPKLNITRTILELGVGEALVSFLDEKGRPGVTERVWIASPGSRIGPVTDAERAELIRTSLVAGVYDKAVDRESAYEAVQKVRSAQEEARQAAEREKEAAKNKSGLEEFIFGSTGPRGGHKDGLVQSVAKSIVREQTKKAVNKGLSSLIGSVLKSFFK